jgi:hypothetical protein
MDLLGKKINFKQTKRFQWAKEYIDNPTKQSCSSRELNKDLAKRNCCVRY